MNAYKIVKKSTGSHSFKISGTEFVLNLSSGIHKLKTRES